MSRVLSVARWVPMAMLLASLAGIGVAWMAGGIARVAAWYLLDLVPFGAAPLALGAAVAWAVRRRAGPATRTTLFVAVPSTALFLKAFAVVPIAFPADMEATVPPATVRLPSNEPLVVVWGGESLATNYHAIDPTQRWAYDFVVEPALHGSPDAAAYGCWDTPVVAPADGRVVQVENTLDDHVPGVHSNDTTHPCGNHVVLRLQDTDTHLLLCHLRKGSVAVEKDAVVAEGQELGRCGNSGNTSEPHIHMHHQRQPLTGPLIFGEALPLFFRGHDGKAMPLGGVSEEGEAAKATGDRVRHLGVP